MMAARNQQPGDDGRHAERGSQFRRTSLVRATDFPSLGQAFRRHEVKCTCCFAEELIRVYRESISRVAGSANSSTPQRLERNLKSICKVLAFFVMTFPRALC